MPARSDDEGDVLFDVNLASWRRIRGRRGQRSWVVGE
ncbi:hypothetical protein ACHAWF_008936 [Thalassiosira exigua]